MTLTLDHEVPADTSIDRLADARRYKGEAGQKTGAERWAKLDTAHLLVRQAAKEMLLEAGGVDTDHRLASGTTKVTLPPGWHSAES